MKQNTDFLNPYKLTLLRELDQKCKQGDLEAKRKIRSCLGFVDRREAAAMKAYMAEENDDPELEKMRLEAKRDQHRSNVMLWVCLGLVVVVGLLLAFFSEIFSTDKLNTLTILVAIVLLLVFCVLDSRTKTSRYALLLELSLRHLQQREAQQAAEAAAAEAAAEDAVPEENIESAENLAEEAGEDNGE